MCESNKVLVTGGAGFIGSHVCEALLDLGWNVLALDSFDPYYPRKIKERNIAGMMTHKRFSFREIDITHKTNLNVIFKVFQPTHVVHLAARPGVRASLKDSGIYEAINIRGTMNVLAASQEAGVVNFVFASSSSVYGATNCFPFCEDTTDLRPISPYGVTKVTGEVLCHVYHELAGFKTTCLRFFTVYGPRQRPDMAIRKFAGLIMNEIEIPVYGDGTTFRDYTFISDIVDGIVSAIQAGVDFEIVNLGAAKTIKLIEMIRMLEAALGRRAHLRYQPPQLGDVPGTLASIEKAKKLLHFQPQIGMEQGIEIFARWFSDQWEEVAA